MNTQIATEAAPRVRRSARVLVVSALGPLTIAAGFVWAVVQPARITLLHPRGQGLWWLFAEAPLLVIAAGAFFALAIAPSLVEDLER
jgi:hypothetical protein